MMKYDFDNWTYADFIQFAKAMQDNELEAAMVLAERVVERDTDASFLDMDVEEADRAMYEVMQALNKEIERLNVNKCKVDLKKWSMRRMAEFRDAQKNQKAALVEAMLHEVVTLEGATPNRPLTFLQGAAMVRAIMERHGKLLSGKA